MNKWFKTPYATFDVVCFQVDEQPGVGLESGHEKPGAHVSGETARFLLPWSAFSPIITMLLCRVGP